MQARGVVNADRPLVSVVLCTYQQARYAEEAVRSVLEQTYEHVELVVVDNGSSDNTGELLRAIDDPRVRLLLHDENAPVTRRLNEGIAASKGELVSLLYGDDLYLRSKFERQVPVLVRQPDVGVVYGPGIRRNVFTGEEWLDASITGSGNVLDELLLARGRGRFINPISPLVRRQCFEQHPFYEDIFVEGESHYLRIATTHRFAYLKDATVVMRDHDENMGKALRPNWELLDEVLRRLEHAPTLPAGAARNVQRSRADLHRSVAWLALRLGADPRWARTCLRLGWRAERAQMMHLKTLLTLGMALLPSTAVRRLNRLGYRLRPPREVVGLRQEY